MEWNRFDICEALNLLAHDWGLYDVKARLDRMNFRCAPSAEYFDGLTDNGQEIYNWHNSALENSAPMLRTDYA